MLGQKTKGRIGRRLAVWGSGGVAAAIAALMIVTPAALAHTVMVAPYKGTASSPYNYGYVNGCGAKAKNTVPAKWTGINGRIAMSESASVGTCSSGPGGGSAYASANIVVVVPIKLPGGNHTVKVSWIVNETSSQKFKSGGGCPAAVLSSSGYGSSYCSSGTSVSLSAFGYVVDVSSGYYYYATNQWGGYANGTYQYNDEYCYSFTCTWNNGTQVTKGPTGALSFTSWFNVTSSKGDQVVVQWYFYANADANAQGYPGSTSSATVNMGGAGMGAYMQSIAW